MSNDSGLHIGWRLFFAVLGAGLTFVVLTVSGLQLSMPIMIAISAGVALLVAIFGPIMLDLLNVF